MKSIGKPVQTSGGKKMPFEVGDKVCAARTMRFGAQQPEHALTISQGTQGEIAGIVEIDTDNTPLSYLVVFGEMIFTVQSDILYPAPAAPVQSDHVKHEDVNVPDWMTGRMIFNMTKEMPEEVDGASKESILSLYESFEHMGPNHPVRKVALWKWGLGE